MRNAWPGVAYFHAVNGYGYGVLFANGKNAWDIHWVIPFADIPLKKLDAFQPAAQTACLPKVSPTGSV